MNNQQTTAPSGVTQRRWLTVEQLAQEFPAFTKPAIRSLIQRSRHHYNHRGEWVGGNGLAAAISQPGGKNGKVMVDAITFALWLESWTSNEKTPEVAAANESRCNAAGRAAAPNLPMDYGPA